MTETEKPKRFIAEGTEQTYTPKVSKIYYLDFEVARDFARFCHYLDPPISASQGVQEAMQFYMMTRQKDIVCTAQFIVKPVMTEEKQLEKAYCEVKNCKEEAIGKGVYRGKETYALCEVHMAEYKESKEWKLRNDITESERNDSRLERALGHLPQESEQP
jgi:hypothetical protein